MTTKYKLLRRLLDFKKKNYIACHRAPSRSPGVPPCFGGPGWHEGAKTPRRFFAEPQNDSELVGAAGPRGQADGARICRAGASRQFWRRHPGSDTAFSRDRPGGPSNPTVVGNRRCLGCGGRAGREGSEEGRVRLMTTGCGEKIVRMDGSIAGDRAPIIGTGEDDTDRRRASAGGDGAYAGGGWSRGSLSS